MGEKLQILFGEMLVLGSILTEEQLEKALVVQKEQRDKGNEVHRIGTILIDMGYLDKEDIEEYIKKIRNFYFD